MEFDVLWNFPHCIGAVDGKHVVITAPPRSGSTYFNYKNTHSIVLMAIANAQYKFIYIDVGCNGRIADGGVFNKCSFAVAMKNNQLHLPKPIALPGRTMPVPFLLVADDAFSMKPNVLKPYSGRSLSVSQRVFNYRLSRARRIVENAFGIMAKRFGVFNRPMHLDANKAKRVTLACCALHNFLLEKSAVYVPSIDIGGNSILGSQANESTLECDEESEDIPTQRIRKDAEKIREEYEQFFMSTEGEVSWQYEYI